MRQFLCSLARCRLGAAVESFFGCYHSKQSWLRFVGRTLSISSYLLSPFICCSGGAKMRGRFAYL